ncbi:hypothetical protein [Mesobacillus sp. S13]|uniref:hypothetical protein n=1 Tax=Mesobacillus sp. S13 TaxID=2880221 RepID=UPI001CF0E0AC|nr:hypothetical protein [Mesobacillus sp. S13]
MPNIAYLNRKTKMGYDELLNLPYPIFLSLLRENQILDLKETSEGREYLEKIERLNVTTPDFGKLSGLSRFNKAGEK